MILCDKEKGRCIIEGYGDELLNDFGNIVVGITDILLREADGNYDGVKDELVAFTEFCIEKTKKMRLKKELIEKLKEVLEPDGQIDILSEIAEEVENDG